MRQFRACERDLIFLNTILECQKYGKLEIEIEIGNFGKLKVEI